MGLDFSIEVRPINKIEQRVYNSTEIAYWRNFWGVRDDIIDIVSKSNKCHRHDEDTWYQCDISILDEIICYLEDICDKKSHSAHSNCAWDNSIEARKYTKSQLDRLILWREVYTRLTILAHTPQRKRGKKYVNEVKECTKIIVNHFRLPSNFCIIDIFNNIKVYKFMIEVNNSY